MIVRVRLAGDNAPEQLEVGESRLAAINSCAYGLMAVGTPHYEIRTTAIGAAAWSVMGRGTEL